MDYAYYTLKQVSGLLQLSERTIQRKIKAGLIPKATFSGKILIPAWWIEKGGQLQEVSNTNSNQ